MTFLTCTLDLRHDHAEAMGDAFIEAGALSVSVEDADEGTSAEQAIFGEPGADAGLWNHCRLIAMFTGDSDVDKIVATVCSRLALDVPGYEISGLDDVDWVQRNRDQFQPIRISERIWIVPTWHSAPHADAVNIALDPGAAFGTGSHPTTRLCLQWLEANLSAPAQQSVLDYGCGSGILAIAAKRLGAGPVTGTDLDPQALIASRANAEVNRVDCTFAAPDALAAGAFDCVAANILTNPLKALAPALAARVRPGGRIVLSGILADQAADVIAVYRPWFNIGVWRTDEGWAALSGIRREAARTTT